MTMQNNAQSKENINNSDILFIYDAKLCNPNGDPDDENKPRMDYDSQKNLVSDVRLKRYIRDYVMGLKDKNGSPKYEVFVAQVEGETVDATKRLVKLIEKHKDEIKNNAELKNLVDNKDKPQEKNLSSHIDWLLSKLIDVRLFGATMPLKSQEGRGASITFTGPIQFNWGYSLNRVQIVESSTITSTFAGRGEEYSTMGKDWRVYYSLIAFHGIVSGKRAEKTNLSKEDIRLLDNSLLKAIPLQATTRSKIGQTPRLLLRIEYKDSTTFLGDLRRYVEMECKENLRDINEVKLLVTPLVDLIKANKDKINKIYVWQHADLRLKSDNEEKTLKELLKNNKIENEIEDLPHPEN